MNHEQRIAELEARIADMQNFINQMIGYVSTNSENIMGIMATQKKLTDTQDNIAARLEDIQRKL